MADAPHTELPRRLGAVTATLTVAGILIGSGIFRVPAGVAAHAGTPAAMLRVWVAGGVLTLCVALSYAELAMLFPRDGGTYVYIREGFGRGAAFVYGWTFLLTNPSAWAAIAPVFAEYAGHFVPMTDVQERLLAVSLILTLATANYRSVMLGAGEVRDPQRSLPRSYRTPGYPWVPLVYALGVAVILVNAIVETPLITLGDIGISLLGIPVYLV